MATVELTPDVIEAAVGRVQAAGIEWRDDTLEVIELDERQRRCSPKRSRTPVSSVSDLGTRGGPRADADGTRRQRPQAGGDALAGPEPDVGRTCRGPCASGA